MRKSVALAALALVPLLSETATSQALVRPAGVAYAHSTALPHFTQTSATCDNSALKSAETRRTIGGLAMLGGLAVYALNWAPMFFGGESGKFDGLVVPASGAIIAGGVLTSMSVASPDAWNRATSGFKAGQTTNADVLACLGKPGSKTTKAGDESWTYTALHPALFGRGKPALTTTLAFKNGVLASLEKTETTP